MARRGRVIPTEPESVTTFDRVARPDRVGSSGCAERSRRRQPPRWQRTPTGCRGGWGRPIRDSSECNFSSSLRRFLSRARHAWNTRHGFPSSAAGGWTAITMAVAAMALRGGWIRGVLFPFGRKSTRPKPSLFPRDPCPLLLFPHRCYFRYELDHFRPSRLGQSQRNQREAATLRERQRRI
jgi:hypothetical protein